MFCTPFDEKQTSLKKLVNLNFYGNLSQNSHFLPSTEPKGPQGPIETPENEKNIFSELPAYENPIV